MGVGALLRPSGSDIEVERSVETSKDASPVKVSPTTMAGAAGVNISPLCENSKANFWLWVKSAIWLITCVSQEINGLRYEISDNL